MFSLCFSMKLFMNFMYFFFLLNLSNINKSEKNYLLEIYIKERFNMFVCFFYVLIEKLEVFIWYCW